MRLNLQVKLYPTKQMRTYLDSQCDYRRYCWNKGLEVWNNLYDQRLISLPTHLKVKIKESLKDKSIQFTEEETNLRKEFPSPTERHVRNELVANKSDWEYENSSRVLQLAVKDLSDTWIRFFKKSQESSSKPKFKRRKEPKQGFKTDSARIKNGRLLLDKPRAYTGPWESIRFKGYSIPDGAIKLCAITRVKNQYLATLSIDVETTPLTPTSKVTAVDANVDHFDYTDGVCTLRPQELNRLYGKVKHYQRVLARKRKVNGKSGIHSKSYQKTRTKLQITYSDIKHIQNDLLHKLPPCCIKTMIPWSLRICRLRKCRCPKRLKVFIVRFLVDSVSLWNIKLKSSKGNWSLPINIIPQPSVVPLVGISKQVMRR